MRPITVTVGNLVTAASATAVRTATTAAAGELVLNGAQVTNGIATFETDRNVLVTFAGAEPGLRLTIQGINTRSDTVSETLYGPIGAGTVLSTNQYRKIASVSSNQASVGAISIGTSATGTSPWVYLDPWAFTPIGVQVAVLGTVNWGIQVTTQDPTAPINPVALNDVVWFNAPDAGLVGQAVGATGQLTVPYAFARVFLNSGSGSATAVFTQPGVVNL